MEAIGQQIILELEGCPRNLLTNKDFVSQTLNKAAAEMGATVVITQFHQFSPYGISGVVVIQESHLTIHTWPEHGYAAIDIFTCGDIEMQKGVNFLTQAFAAKNAASKTIPRGLVASFKQLQ